MPRAHFVNKPHQRRGSISNAHAGKEFELAAQSCFLKHGLNLTLNFPLEISVKNRAGKKHNFDLGSHEHSIIVECKSHTWTEGDKVPSAKMTTWNQEMYFLHLAPKQYRKILFVLRNVSPKRQMSLADYYVKTYMHLIPEDVEIWEFNPDTGETRNPLEPALTFPNVNV
ncbi:hypothetical protein COO20_05425 [Thalassospira marina]|uniref:Uncharacterized protein n=1 Tax=Thalassospira marina TaxID=2048283 RepID=A0A2N3KYM6_9PROT|nr:hypothetical protein COO20_05425 [Thalassospira marina]